MNIARGRRLNFGFVVCAFLHRKCGSGISSGKEVSLMEGLYIFAIILVLIMIIHNDSKKD